MKIGEMVTKLEAGKALVGTVIEVKQEGNLFKYKAKNLRDGYEFEGEIRKGGRSVTIVPSLKGVLLVLALVGASPSDSHAIECQARAGGSGWSWRLIDGKRCWYKGTRRIDKKKLSWNSSVKPKPRVRPFISESAPVDEPVVPLRLDEPMTFEERWCALCIRGR